MKRTRRFCFLLLLVFAVLILGACDSGMALISRPVSRQVFAMDTVMNLSAYGSKAEAALEKCVNTITQLEEVFSVNIASSDISNINRNAGQAVHVSEDTMEALRTANKVSLMSDGAFDVTIYPLVSLWGFSTDIQQVPEDLEIKRRLPFVDYKKIRLNTKQQTVKIPEGFAIDLGGVAKGYTSQKLADLLELEGVTSAMLSLGGNVQLIGSKPGGDPWHVGVQHPEKANTFLGTLSLSDCAVITSGSYQRNFTENGRLYHHIINPDTGYPAGNGLLSVTIVAKDGAYADALSTACFVLGEQRALELWQERGDFEMILVNISEEVIVTSGLANIFIPDEKSSYTYTFAN